jgi:murein endopeptidase/LysM repeat protein
MTRLGLLILLLALTGCAAAPGRDALQTPVAMGGPGAPQTPQGAAAGPQTPQGAVPAASAEAPPADPPAAATPAADEELAALEDDDGDDQEDSAGPPATSSPLLALSDDEIEKRFKQDAASLGSISVGRPSAGVLVNGVQMPRSDRWVLLDPGRAYGTQETVDALARCIDRVNERFPGAPPLSIGHISAKAGGHLSPHVSHQAGRDADVGYYYRAGTRPFVHATEQNLDLPRTWALVRAALKETHVDMIFMDASVQRLLAAYATANGEDPAFVDASFQVRGKNARAPVRHIHGHDNHIHFRFHSPIAEEMGRRVARFVPIPHEKTRVASSSSGGGGAKETGFAPIKARSGDTLVILARRYGTTVEEIQRANGLRSNAIRAGVVYRIPQKVAPGPPPARTHHGAHVALVAHKAPQPKPRAGAASSSKPSAAPQP